MAAVCRVKAVVEQCVLLPAFFAFQSGLCGRKSIVTEPVLRCAAIYAAVFKRRYGCR